MGEPTYEFKCMTARRAATGRVWPDRIEIETKAPLRRPSTQVVPTRSMTSVSSARDGITWQKITIHTAGDDVVLRVARKHADEVVDRLQQLLLA